MVIDYFGGTASQSDIVYYITGTYNDVTGYYTDVVKALSHWNINSSGTNTTIAFSSIESEITNNQPIIAGIKYAGLNEGHNFVIRGYYNDTDTGENDVYIY